ncbi:hypothetical protein [Streptomyces sp. 8N616]|uniref:hypothetical protein n=1 Tax=Streptomyces sp. 8N616 TaxID=3457414 RepID=UPI003FCFE285
MSRQHIPAQPALPSQPQPQPQPRPESRPQPEPAPRPAASEATRLLCAGTYLDDDYRDAVLDELYVHEERIAAPSLGIDAARVLAHALRARRLQAVWAVAVVALWVLAFVFASTQATAFLIPCVLLVLAARLRGGTSGPFHADYPGARRTRRFRRVAAAYLRLVGRLSLALYAVSALMVATADEETLYELQSTDLIVSDERAAAWFALVIPLAMAACIGAHREQVARIISRELQPEAFADRARPDVAEATAGERFARLQQRIRLEQRSPLIYYHPQQPFLGAGSPYEPWTLAVELRRDQNAPGKPLAELNNREVLRRVKPLVENLRTPANPDAPQAATVRDRLRGLEVDECVFVRATGVPVRAQAPLQQKHFDAERERAIEEGGEGRRHFLRIRVGAWEEEVVITVFVRVHTQGRMLMLEIAPHVLRPVRRDFRAVDRVSANYWRGKPVGRAVWALGQLPTGAVRSVVHAFREAGFLWRMWTGGHAAALPDGPWTSVRELGSDEGASLFQEMDVSRYLKSVQDRVANGVRQALAAAGWQTDEFVQQVVNVSGVYIGSAENSAIAVGDHNTLENKPAEDQPAAGGEQDQEQEHVETGGQ